MVDSHAIVFVGFTSGIPIDLGFMTIDSISTPFTTLMLTAVDGKQTLTEANRLLLTTVARGAKHGHAMERDPDECRHALGNNA